MSTVEELIEALAMRVQQLEVDFAQIRLDLKAAMILPDEEYVPPPVDDLSPNTTPPAPTKSQKVQELEKNDPFE